MASSAESQVNVDVNGNASSGTDSEPELYFSFYLRLYRATLKGDWATASAFFDGYPGALKARIAATLDTALHIAVAKTSRSGLHFVEKLIERMSPEALALTGSRGRTALAIAAEIGNIEAAKLLVGKNRDLPNMRDGIDELPLHAAAKFGHGQMLVYLLDVTRDDVELSPFLGESGVSIVCHIIFAEFYDLAMKLVKQYPALAACNREVARSPLDTMVNMPHAFPSGSNLNIWQRFIYSWIPIEACLNCLFDGATVSGQMQTGSLLHFLAEKCVTLVPQMRHIRDLKIKHRQSLQLVKFLCDKAANLDYKRAESILTKPLFYAASKGIHEIVEEIVEAFPPAVWLTNDKHYNIFEISVLYRRENVFNLLYQMDQPTSLTAFRDRSKNTILHLAGGLAPSHRLNLISGAVLQMQRELQWFKEVEKFVPPVYKEIKNGEMKTPAMVFTEEHKELVIKGEKWMKDTANSCSLVAALIATVVFAATITLPGGNNSNTGFPMFRNQKAFMVFAVFDALSLFSSSASILMFLSIMTARYADSDFLYALPKRLVIGLSTLFLSIAFMMVAFSAALYLVFGHNKAWVLAVVVAFASIPITLFVTLQFPLLVDMIYSTYGPGIFGKQSERPFY